MCRKNVAVSVMVLDVAVNVTAGVTAMRRKNVMVDVAVNITVTTALSVGKERALHVFGRAQRGLTRCVVGRTRSRCHTVAVAFKVLT